MLDFDLRDTVAGQEIFEEGIQEGIQEGIITEARASVIEALTERFVAIPPGIRESVYSVGDHEMLKTLLRHAIRGSHLEDFNKALSKVLSVSKGKIPADD